MKIQTVIALIATASFVTAKPLHKGLNYERYLQKKNETIDAFLKYRESDGFAAAMNLGLVNKEDRDGEPSEDQLQRFHMACELCDDMKKMHPDAEFSVNGPFMTAEEFSNYVGLSNGGKQGMFLGARPDSADDRRKLRSQGGNWDSSTVGKVHPNFNFDSINNARQGPNKDGPVAPTPCPDPDRSTAPGPKPGPVAPTDAPGPKPGPVAPTDAPGPAPGPKPGPVAPTDAPGPAPSPSSGPKPRPSNGSGGGNGNGVDWNAKGCVASVRNQGQCGSCWAFAATAAIESAMCIKGGSGKLPELSDQQITSCDTKNGGCGGGVPAYAIDYVKKNGGMCSLEAYPYKAASVGQCNSQCQKVPISINKAVSVTGEESNLAKAIEKQPVAVAVAAGNNAWKQYRGGVLASCDTQQLDHAVLAYGYTDDAWLIKNSWGTSWGDKGMIKLKRGTGGKGTCGIMSQGSYPELA